MIVQTYIAYTIVTIFLTVLVAQTLYRNGRVFLIDVFHGNEALADSVNRLLVVGFYLINLGYVSLMLKIGTPVDNAQESIEALAGKLGLVMLVLGGMHFFNLFVFNRMRANALDAEMRKKYLENYVDNNNQPPAGPAYTGYNSRPFVNPQG